MKRYRVVILPAALADIRATKDWYNEQQKGLGIRFTKMVHATVKRVAHYPYHFAVRYNDTRMAQLNTFPYLVHYYVDESHSSIVVLAVLSASRNPEIWSTRQ